jgi:hypothetical protein
MAKFLLRRSFEDEGGGLQVHGCKPQERRNSDLADKIRRHWRENSL